VARGWPVIAANTPRPIATKVAHDGLDALASSSDADKTLYATDRACPPKGGYYKRFVKEMGGHSGSTDRYYQAQCLKDETMAESIAQAYAVGAMGGKRPLVVHVTGAFHSDYREGTVERTTRRLPGKRVLVLSIVPIEKLPERAPGSSDRKRADFLLFTPQAPR
jgi:uncharacterized iron-regulated protein